MSVIYDAIVIGSGAAGYSAADWLFRYGIDNIAVIAEGRLMGTSRNTGSDKQTFYKLSLDGKAQDCAYNMACDIAIGGSCDGVLAYTEAVNSVRCFMRLIEYGVPFPTDLYGAYPGYRTDHDSTRRATSIGPLTSKVMTEKLEHRVLKVNKTTLLDGMQVIKILVSGGRAYGVLALCSKENRIVRILARNIIAATGAPACIYSESVYPRSQHGMTGVLLSTGAKLCNFAQWQYGMASVDFRWNVSGSYMQVIPRVISVDENGKETEFLTEHYGSASEACSRIFLKGYQWPFSYERINGSSEIDMLVHEQTSSGNKVYLDYMQNPEGFDFNSLSDEARTYLVKAQAAADTPIERLEKLNSKAIALYKSNNIDLSREYLRIAVCAQHNNGGVYVDENYETSIKNLYAIGEAAGVFGLTRQGGTALCSTQVGGLVCAKHISNKTYDDIEEAQGESEEAYYRKLCGSITEDKAVSYKYIRQKMSDAAAFIRNEEKCLRLLGEIEGILENYPCKSKSVNSYFYDLDMLVSAKALLTAITQEMPLTGSRGGSIYLRGNNILEENKRYREFLSVLSDGNTEFVPARAVPDEDYVFEKHL